MSTRFTAIWSYPWDLFAEGLDESLDRIAKMGLNGISLAVSYHSGMLLLPHNPRQRIRFLEDGAIYFRPHSGYFQDLAIQPRVSEMAGSGDPLEEICEAAERHGLEVVSWTVCTHNSYQGERHLDMTIRNAFGDPLIYGLCPSHPDVQAYLQALLQELSDYPLRTLQLESYGFLGFPHGYHHEKINMDLGPYGRYLMGLCFCPACRKVAEGEGVDFAAAQSATRRYLEDIFEGRAQPPEPFSEEALLHELPELEPYLQMRDEVVKRFVLRLSGAAAKPLNLLGIEQNMVEELSPHIAEVTGWGYRVTPEETTRVVREARALVGPSMTLGVGIEACPHMSPTKENLVAKVKAAWDAGADNLYFYNYGLMPLRSLDWLREALQR